MSASPESTASSTLPWRISACFNILDDIQEQIRFADSKAGFISAFNMLLFGFIASHLDKLRALYVSKDCASGCIAFALMLVGIYVVSMVITFTLVVTCVISRFGGGAPQGRVFFAHIVARYGKNHQQYARDIDAMSESAWLDELGAQIVEVSRLAVLKHKCVRWAAFCTLITVLLWIGSLTTMVSLFWMQSP